MSKSYQFYKTNRRVEFRFRFFTVIAGRTVIKQKEWDWVKSKVVKLNVHLYLSTKKRVAAFHALVPKLSQKLLNSCTFPLIQYPKSETPNNWIFNPLSPPWFLSIRDPYVHIERHINTLLQFLKDSSTFWFA